MTIMGRKAQYSKGSVSLTYHLRRQNAAIGFAPRGFNMVLPIARASTLKPMSALAVDTTHAHVLDLDIVIQPILSALFILARLLYAAKRRHFMRSDALVDFHGALLECLGDAPDPTHICPSPFSLVCADRWRVSLCARAQVERCQRARLRMQSSALL